MAWVSTKQERVGGFTIQFEVYEQAGRSPRQRYKCLAYHGPLLVAQETAATEAEARRKAQAAYVAKEQQAAADLAASRA